MSSESDLPPFAQATAGAAGSVVSNTIVYPLDLLSTRLQTQSSSSSSSSSSGSGKGKPGIYGALSEIVRTKGVGGLYQGWAADSMSNTLSNFFFFYFRGFLIEKVLARKSARQAAAPTSRGEKSATATITLSAAEDLAVGMLAGIASRFFTTPLSNVTVRHQTSATAKEKEGTNTKGKEKEVEKRDNDSDSDEEGEYGDGPGIVETLKQIVEEKGVAGLWSGYETAVLLSIAPALTFYSTSLISQAFLPRASRDSPSSWQTFLVNASGNATSTAILFPLMLSKTRLQWRSPSGRKVYRNLADVVRKTMRRDGIKGLYQGLESQLLKGLVSHGTTMVVKQRVEALFTFLYLALRARSRRLAQQAA